MKKKKGKTSKFVDSGINNCNERDGINSMEWNEREKSPRKITLKL